MLRSWLHLEGQEKSVAWSHKSPAVPEPNSAKHRAKYAKYTSSIIESIEPLRSIEFIRLQNCPTSGWLARLCWQTSPLGEPAGNDTRVNILSLFVNTNDIIYTSKQFKSFSTSHYCTAFQKNNMRTTWPFAGELATNQSCPCVLRLRSCTLQQPARDTKVTQCDMWHNVTKYLTMSFWTCQRENDASAFGAGTLLEVIGHIVVTGISASFLRACQSTFWVDHRIQPRKSVYINMNPYGSTSTPHGILKVMICYDSFI